MRAVAGNFWSEACFVQFFLADEAVARKAENQRAEMEQEILLPPGLGQTADGASGTAGGAPTALSPIPEGSEPSRSSHSQASRDDGDDGDDDTATDIDELLSLDSDLSSDVRSELSYALSDFGSSAK